MIKLTATITEGNLYLSSDQIRVIYSERGKTHVVCGEIAYPVAESPEEVARLITEAKYRKMKLQAAYMTYYQPEARQPDDLISRLEKGDTP